MRRRTERGMVTVELAFASLVAMLLGVGVLLLVAIGLQAARCHETAAEVARQAARADQVAVQRAIADAPPGARVGISRTATEVSVTVEVTTRPWGRWLPAVPLSTTATVLVERP